MHRYVHNTLPAAVLAMIWIAKEIILRTRNVVQFLVLIAGGARPTIKRKSRRLHEGEV
jgi:hypothetical protein